VDRIGSNATIGAAVDRIGSNATIGAAVDRIGSNATIGAAVDRIGSTENVAPPDPSGFIRPSLPSRIYPEAVFMPVAGV
jgi:hypothetical protein